MNEGVVVQDSIVVLYKLIYGENIVMILSFGYEASFIV